MKKIVSLVILLFLLFFLNGCYDYVDVSKSLHVNSICFDIDEEKSKYIVYYHLTNSTTLTTSELGNSTPTSDVFSIAKGEGEDIYEAMEQISVNTNRKIELTHVRAIIFSKKFINIKNLTIVHNFIETTTYLFPDPNIYVTESEITDILSLKNVENGSPYFSLIADHNTKEHYILTPYIEITKFLSKEYNTLNIPILVATKDIWSNDKDKLVSISISGRYYLNQSDISYIIKDEVDKGLVFLESNKSFEISYKNILYEVISLKKKYKVISQDEIVLKIKMRVYINEMDYSKKNNLKIDFRLETLKVIGSLIENSQNNNFDIFDIENKVYRRGKLKSSFDYKATNMSIILDITFTN